MKKYIIFAGSFIVLFSLFEGLSGVLLTFLYTPNLEVAWEMSAHLPQEVELNFSGGSFFTIFFVFLSAIVAYFISKGLSKSNFNRPE